MKYLALIMLVSSIFAGSANAHGMMYRMAPCAADFTCLRKDEVQNAMLYNRTFGHSMIIMNHRHPMGQYVWPY